MPSNLHVKGQGKTPVLRTCFVIPVVFILMSAKKIVNKKDATWYFSHLFPILLSCVCGVVVRIQHQAVIEM